MFSLVRGLCIVFQSSLSYAFVKDYIRWRRVLVIFLFSQVTYRRMKDALIQLSKGVQKGPASDLIPVLFGERAPTVAKKEVTFSPFNKNLDHSQVLKPNICTSLFLVFAIFQDATYDVIMRNFMSIGTCSIPLNL